MVKVLDCVSVDGGGGLWLLLAIDGEGLAVIGAESMGEGAIGVVAKECPNRATWDGFKESLGQVEPVALPVLAETH